MAPVSLGFNIFVVALVIVVIVTIALGVRTIPQGYSYTVERFGRFSRSLGPGLGLIIPYIERIGHKINIMEQVLDVPSQEAFTRDNAGVRIDAVAFYQVLEAARASYEVSSLQEALLTLTMTNIRTVVGSMALDDLLSHRDEINEGLRQAAILRAEGEKQAQILAAEGRREAAFRDAEARERSAEAEAKATTMVSQAISSGDLAAANFLVAEKYVDAFRALATAPNQKVIIVPTELGALAGTLGGIAEITRSVFGDGSGAAPPPARSLPPTSGQQG